jgi:hypothetical protein
VDAPPLVPGQTIARVKLPRPRPHQLESINSRKRWKLWRWGRRAGKSRGAIIAAAIGHGPPVDRGHGPEPLHRGFLRGGIIAWIGLDYTQAEKIWREVIKPRFEGVPGFKVEEGAFRVIAPAYGPVPAPGQPDTRPRGEITIYTANNVETLLGSQLDGVILDEFAHWEGDPEDAWRRVLRFTLVDRRGWAIFPSTSWPGSYFDSLCALELEGKRPNWFQSHFATEDNDVLSPDEVAEVYSEYDPADVRVQTELKALLIAGGAGLAFPEFESIPEKRVHVVTPAPIPRFYRAVVGLDWGWRTGRALYCALGPEEEVIARLEIPLAELHGEAAGEHLIEVLLERGLELPELVAYDAQMDVDAGIETGATIAQEFRRGMVGAIGGDPDLAPRMVPAAKGNNSRLAGKNMVHKALAWKDARDARGNLEPWAAPRLRIFAGFCPGLILELRTLPNDPKHPGDVDTSKPDHSYDALRYLLAVRAQGGLPPEPEFDPDTHPGRTKEGEIRRRTQRAPWEQRARGGFTDPNQGSEGRPGFWDPTAPNIEYEEE